MADEESTKRSRARQACEPCRKKKTKCSGDYPKCTNCTLHGFECVYVAVEKRRGPQKGYVRALESRLDSLQNLLEDYVEKISPSVGPNATEANGENILQGGGFIEDNDNDNLEFGEEINSDHESPNNLELVPVNNNNSKQVVLATGSEVKALDSKNRSNNKEITRFPRPSESYIRGPGQLTRSQHPNFKHINPPKKAGHLSLIENGTTRYLGESSGIYLLRQSKEEDKIELLKVPDNRLVNNNRLRSLDINLNIAKEQYDILIYNYFVTIHPFLPLICQDWFLEEYLKPSSTLPSFLIDSLCALSSLTLSSFNQNIISNPFEYGEVLYLRARQKLMLNIDDATVYSVQSFVLLSFCVHVAHGNKSWSNSGIAIRQGFDLGLHRDFVLKDSSPCNLLEREARRRLWWILYISDRLISVNAGRPLTISEDEFDTPFPDLSGETGALLSNISNNSISFSPILPLHLRRMFFTKYVELSQIYGKITQNIYSVRSRQGYTALKLQSQIHHLDDTLQGWYHTLLQEWPQINSLDATANNPSYEFGLCLKLHHLTMTILLHRPLLPRPTQPISSFARSYFDKCEIAARGIIHIISNCTNVYKDSFIMFKYYPLLVGLSIHTLGASSTFDDQNSREKSKQYAFDTLSILSQFKTSPMSQKIIMGCLDMLTTLDIIPTGYMDESWPDSLKEIANCFHNLDSTQSWPDAPTVPTDNGSKGNQSTPTNPLKRDISTSSTQQKNDIQPNKRILNPTQFLQAHVLKDWNQNAPSMTKKSSISSTSSLNVTTQANYETGQIAATQSNSSGVENNSQSGGTASGIGVTASNDTLISSVAQPTSSQIIGHNIFDHLAQTQVQNQNHTQISNTSSQDFIQQQLFGLGANQISNLNSNNMNNVQTTNNLSNNNSTENNQPQTGYLLGFNALAQQSLANPILFGNNNSQAQQQIYFRSLLQQQNQVQAQVQIDGPNLNNFNQSVIDPNQLMFSGFGTNSIQNLTGNNNTMESFGWDPLYNFDFNFNPST